MLFKSLLDCSFTSVFGSVDDPTDLQPLLDPKLDITTEDVQSKVKERLASLAKTETTSLDQDDVEGLETCTALDDVPLAFDE